MQIVCSKVSSSLARMAKTGSQETDILFLALSATIQGNFAFQNALPTITSDIQIMTIFLCKKMQTVFIFMISFSFYIYPGRRPYFHANITDEETES